MTVDVPGGSVQVELSVEEAVLTGPAVLVAAGTVDPGFWDRHR
jgi:diaminopimelate epimerase